MEENDEVLIHSKRNEIIIAQHNQITSSYRQNGSAHCVLSLSHFDCLNVCVAQTLQMRRVLSLMTRVEFFFFF